MTIGVTIAQKDGKWEVVTDPNVPFSEQRRAFRVLCGKLTETHDEVQLLSSSQGRVKRKKLRKLVAGSTQIAVEDNSEGSDEKTPVVLPPVVTPKKNTNTNNNLI